MAQTDKTEISIELSEDGRRLLEFSESFRRLGRLEAQLPEAYAELRRTPDGELRAAIDAVFARLLWKSDE